MNYDTDSSPLVDFRPRWATNGQQIIVYKASQAYRYSYNFEVRDLRHYLDIIGGKFASLSSDVAEDKCQDFIDKLGQKSQDNDKGLTKVLDSMLEHLQREGHANHSTFLEKESTRIGLMLTTGIKITKSLISLPRKPLSYMDSLVVDWAQSKLNLYFLVCNKKAGLTLPTY